MQKWWQSYFKQVDGSYLLGWGMSIAFVLVYLLLRHADHGSYRSMTMGELGFEELTQNLVLVLSVLVALRILFRPSPQLCLWSFLKWLLPLGLVVLLAEEISWGSYFVGTDPTVWLDNMQHDVGENLHKSYPIYYKLSKVILQAGLIFCCFVWPWMHKDKKFAKLIAPYMPDATCLMPVVLSFLMVIYRAVFRLLSDHAPAVSEARETLFYIFILSAVWMLHQRQTKFLKLQK